MNDTSQELLANFVRNGSESAFRELVTSYLDLVYSTAIWLVDGDTHRAEDVSQIVFADLARMAGKPARPMERLTGRRLDNYFEPEHTLKPIVFLA